MKFEPTDAECKNMLSIRLYPIASDNQHFQTRFSLSFWSETETWCQHFGLNHYRNMNGRPWSINRRVLDWILLGFERHRKIWITKGKEPTFGPRREWTNRTFHLTWEEWISRCFIASFPFFLLTLSTCNFRASVCLLVVFFWGPGVRVKG